MIIMILSLSLHSSYAFMSASDARKISKQNRQILLKDQCKALRKSINNDIDILASMGESILILMNEEADMIRKCDISKELMGLGYSIAPGQGNINGNHWIDIKW